MKWIFFLFFSLPIFSQNPPNTEVFLFDLTANGGYQVTNGKNISLNPGYDNQPSFYSDNVLIYAKTRNGQTDIAGYNIPGGQNFWISNTPQGGEYSPQRFANQPRIAAVRLDTNGLQRLYSYDVKTGKDSLLLADLKIGYYAFSNQNKLISAVLTGSGLDLVVSDLSQKTNDTVMKSVGRSIHKVPNSAALSYTLINENGQLDLYLLDITEAEPSSFFVCELPIGIQDYIWLDENRILLGSRNKLFVYDTLGVTEWTEIADLSNYMLDNITRMAINSTGTKLALVAETTAPSPEEVVQEQLEAYNARDIDAFMATYANDIKIYNFPAQLMTEGHENMRENYEPFFKNTLDLHCTIKNRIVMGNKIIDEEHLTINGQSHSAVAIYEVEGGKIVKVTFLR